MPSPSPTTPGNTNLRPDLADAVMEFDLEMERRNYVGHEVFPVLDVGLAADNPGKLKLEDLLFVGETSRASNAGYGRGEFKFDRWTYATEEHGWEEVVSERDKKRYRHIIDAETVATMRAVGVVTRSQETRVASSVFDTDVWTGAELTTAVATPWSSPTSKPIGDVEGAVKKVYDGTGLWANALIIDRLVFRNLRNCDEIIDRIASSGAGNATKASDITESMLAQIFDLDHIIVAGASQNTAKKNQTRSISQIWDNGFAMVARVAETNDIQEPCLGRTFHWSEDGSEIGGTVEEYFDDTKRGNVIRVRHETDEVVMYKEAGHLLSNITTPAP